jgi:zinc finger-containing ubiquitin peptidase 1
LSKLHLETFHPENGESPFIVKDDASVAALMAWGDDDRNEEYVSCPVEGCGEALLLTELESHIEMHEEEQDTGDDSSHRTSKKVKVEPKIEAAFDTKLSSSLRNLDDGDSERDASDKQTTVKAAWRALLKMPDSSSKLASSPSKTRRRLGVSLISSDIIT